MCVPVLNANKWVVVVVISDKVSNKLAVLVVSIVDLTSFFLKIKIYYYNSSELYSTEQIIYSSYAYLIRCLAYVLPISCVVY